MPRTTEAAVKLILSDHYDTEKNPSLDSFIATAASLVGRITTKNTSGGFGMSDADLELVERWLSAHFYTHSDMIAASKSTGGSASGSFQGQTGMYFDSTLYGQTAKMLDATGLLANIQKESQEGKQRVSLKWAGTRPSEKVSPE